MRVHRNVVEVSTRARLVPRGALLDQREYGALVDQWDSPSADRVTDQRDSPSADRVADEERGGVSRSGESPQGLGRGLDTCPARTSRGTTQPAGHGHYSTSGDSADRVADQRNSPSADRVADEVRGGVSRSGESPQELGRGLDTCPARSSRGTTRPAGLRGVSRPAELRGTTRPAETHTSAGRASGRRPRPPTASR